MSATRDKGIGAPDYLSFTVQEKTLSRISCSISFNEVIELDHAYLRHLVSRILNHSENLSNDTFFRSVTELMARLIRHDVCEELVMRPAFIRYMGRRGLQMGEHDRKEHGEVKGKLQELAKTWQSKMYDVSRGTKSSDNDDVSAGTGPEDVRKWLSKSLEPLTGELDQHMKEESGNQLEELKKAISVVSKGEGKEEDEGLMLGKMYSITMVLGLHVTKLDKTSSQRIKVFTEGLNEYIGTDIQRFRDILMVLIEGASLETDGGYLVNAVHQELRILQRQMDPENLINGSEFIVGRNGRGKL